MKVTKQIENRIEKIKQLKKEENIRMLVEVREYAKKMKKIVKDFPNADYVTLAFYNKAIETIKLTNKLIRALKNSKKSNAEIIEKHRETTRKIIDNVDFLKEHEIQMRIGFFEFF